MLSVEPLGVEKEKFNLSLPLALMKEFEAITDSRRKWAGFAAAVLALLDMPPEARRLLMGNVVASEIGGRSMESLIGAAHAGELRSQMVEQVKAIAADSKRKPRGVAS